MKKLIGVLVILAALMLGGYYLMGWGTERILKDNLAVLNRSNGNIVELQEYNRGWFTSTALLKWVVKVPEPATLRIPHSLLIADRVYVTAVPLRIYHGPITWANHGLRFGLGYVKSKVLIPTVYNQEYNAVFDSSHSIKPILKITALVSYLTNTRLQLEIPAFSLVAKNATNQFKWLGMLTDVKLSGNKKHIAGHLAVNGFSWIKGDTRGAIGSVNSEYDLRRSLDNVYLGNAHLQLASGILIKDGQQLAEVSDADFTSQNNVHDGLFNSTISLSAKRFAVNQIGFGISHVDVAVANLDAKTLEDMNKKIAQSQPKSEEDKHRALLGLAPDLPMLLSKGAQIKIANLELTFPNGLLKANVNLNFPTQPIYNPLQMMKKLNGVGTIRLSVSLLKNWLQSAMKAHDGDAQAATKLAGKIGYLTAAGILVMDGDEYIIALKLENGRLLVNNHVLSPEMLAI